MRGKPTMRPTVRGYWRITPADAGKTGHRARMARCWGDHPRGCGENADNRGFGADRRGSPPRMRGKLWAQILDKLDTGITPAGAGKTWGASDVSIVSRDHPRRCGENFHCAVFACRNSGSPPQVRGKPASRPERIPDKRGSPPQVRGKLRAGRLVDYPAGITPAGAGKTQSRKSVTASLWDHPRRCGENCITSLHAPYSLGSPPQVRGKLMRLWRPRSFIGITPAGAGKTFLTLFGMLLIWDHPRRCGENDELAIALSGHRGSPPQVRGKLVTVCPARQSTRITPAGAGKTPDVGCSRGSSRDHPRGCGENCGCHFIWSSIEGSPPRMRGKLLLI